MSAEKVKPMGYSVTLPSLPLLAGHPIRDVAQKRAILAGIHVNAKEMGVEAVTKETGAYTEQAWYLLTEDQQKSLAQAIYMATMKQAKDGSGVVRGMVEDFIEQTTKSVIDFKMAELKEAIEKEVEARWQSQVEAAVQQKLDEAIAKIKAEMSK